MSMNYLKAKAVMAFLLTCGIDARFEDDLEDVINIYSDDGEDSLFEIRTDEEWEELKKIFIKVAAGLTAAAPGERHENRYCGHRRRDH